MKASSILWFLFAFLSIGVGLYPLLYFIFDLSMGFLALKATAQYESPVWNFAFYTHIITGGIALITGWSQFSKKLRTKYISTHRFLGKIYLLVVLTSGLTGFYIGIFAFGGWVAKIGFCTLAVLWLISAWKAYTTIRSGDVNGHQRWMTRNYALCWAGVMLRLWLPLFQFGLGLNFLIAYQIISWLCWVPNLLVAEKINRSNS